MSVIDTTTYGRMTRSELTEQYVGIVSILQHRTRELGSVTADYNNDFYPVYFQAPGNSVAAKEREANYKCLTLLNELAQLDAEIKSLTIVKELIETLLHYAPR